MIAIAEQIAGRASISGALLSNELRASDEILSLIRPNLSNEGELMSITIAATASGNSTPTTAMGESVINGDFTINYNRYKDLSNPPNPIDRYSFTTGDGIDEETNWTFYFNEDPNFSLFSSSQPLTSALLTLTLTPKDPGDGITTDAFWIETLDVITGAVNAPEIQNLLKDITATIQIELLDRLPSYSSAAILQILFSSMGGRISMRYQDDAIISSATLELTQASL
jgi:hypothetical protein